MCNSFNINGSDFTQIQIYCHQMKEGKRYSLWFDIKFKRSLPPEKFGTKKTSQNPHLVISSFLLAETLNSVFYYVIISDVTVIQDSTSPYYLACYVSQK